MIRAAFAVFIVAAAAATAAPGATGVRACTARDLKPSIFFQGAAGSLLGGFAVLNRSSTACRLGSARPAIAVFRADGDRVTVKVGSFRQPPSAQVSALRAHRKAIAWIQWSSYCGSLANRPFRFRLTLTTGAVVSASTKAGTVAKCYPTGRNHAGPGTARLALAPFSKPVS